MHRIHGLTLSLAHAVDGVVSDAVLPDREARRVLQFVMRVVEIIEQHFDEACSLLVDVSLEGEEAESPRVRLGLLRERASRLRGEGGAAPAAPPLALRLENLSDYFDECIRPLFNNDSEFTSGFGLAHLVEPRGGQITQSASACLREIFRLIERLDSPAEQTARSIALRRVTSLVDELAELRAFQAQLRDRARQVAGRDAAG